MEQFTGSPRPGCFSPAGMSTVWTHRIHLFVHGMELWEKVKGVDLGTGTLAADIDEAISLGASEVISTHLGYSPTRGLDPSKRNVSYPLLQRHQYGPERKYSSPIFCSVSAS